MCLPGCCVQNGFTDSADRSPRRMASDAGEPGVLHACTCYSVRELVNRVGIGRRLKGHEVLGGATGIVETLNDGVASATENLEPAYAGRFLAMAPGEMSAVAKAETEGS